MSPTIPFNIKILWFSSWATSQAGQHFVMQGISNSPLELLQSKQVIILKILGFFQTLFSQIQRILKAKDEGTFVPTLTANNKARNFLWLMDEFQHGHVIFTTIFSAVVAKISEVHQIQKLHEKKKLKQQACGKLKRTYYVMIVTGTGKRETDSVSVKEDMLQTDCTFKHGQWQGNIRIK